ncbi:DUF1838 family protein [Sphingobium sp. CR2-8]|uniref:DUF1838 family protein n=1 Tax=Sphingobium sp. CR2-8 TaxID=1306534 RepID=UPI002DBAB6FD|nr:DUF1838 family protein [Sphingobium sp. CR2-8]MEC3911245.1 DUF1838 family protein [Sphingobium sp. CR2-8]
MSDAQNDDEPAMTMGRRGALTLGLGAAALAALPATAAVGKRQLDLNSEEDQRLIYRKLRYRTDSGLLFSWVKGPYVAVIDGDLIPMYAINLGAIQRVTQRPDGGFDLVDLEISFRVDVDTGEPMKQMVNPVTKQTIDVVTRPQGPNRISVTRNNEVQISSLPNGTRYEHSHPPTRVFALNDEIVLRDRSHSRVTAPDGSVSMLNEVSTLSGPRALVLDPSVTTINARLQANDMRSWPSWLKMDDRVGHLALLGNGGKVSRFEDLPADWRAMLAQYYPAIAADPVGALDRPAA